MAEYGSFEIGGIRSRGPLITRYDVRRPVDGRQAVVDVFQPATAIKGTARASVELFSFIEAARLQKEAASSSPRLADVFEFGRRDGEAYRVVECAAETLQTLIDLRIQLRANDLRHVATELIAGLKDYHTATGRPHGQLAPRRIWIDQPFEPGEAKLLIDEPAALCDPTKSIEAVDVISFAQLIVRLVEGKPDSSPVRWPIQPDPAWKQLGRSGEKWREFINGLLDPSLLKRNELPGFDLILRQLPVEPRDFRKPMQFTGAAAAVLALVAGGYWIFGYESTLSQEEVEVYGDRLRDLGREYVSWIHDFEAKLGEQPPTVFNDLRSLAGVQAYLTELDESVIGPYVETKINIGLPFDPRQHIDQSELPFEAIPMGLIVPQSVSPSQNLRLNRVIETIESIRTGLKEWSLTERLDSGASQFEQRGWALPAEELRSMHIRLTFADEVAHDDATENRDAFARRDVVGDIRAAIRLGADLQRISAAWATAEIVQRAAAERARAVPQHFIEWLDNSLQDAPTVSAMARTLDRSRSVLDRYRGVVEDDGTLVAWTLFTEAAEIEERAADDLAYYESWIDLVEAYRRIPVHEDPRRAGFYRSTLLSIDETLNQIVKLEAEREAAELTVARADLSTEVSELLDLPAIERHRDQITRSAAEISARLENFATHTTNVFDSVNVAPAEYLADQFEQVRFATGSLQGVWRRHLQQSGLAARLAADISAYGDFRTRTNRLRDALEALDGDAVRVTLVLPPDDPQWDREIVQRYLADQRDVAVERLSRALESRLALNEPIGPRLLDEPAVAAALRSEREQLSDRATEVGNLTESMLRLATLLNEAYLPDESPADGLATLATDLAAWRGADGLRGEVMLDLRPAFSSILARCDAQERMLSNTQSTQIIGQLDEVDIVDRPELFVAAWRRLGALSFDNGRRIDPDRRVISDIRTWAGGAGGNSSAPVTPEPRRRTIRDRVLAEAPDRWLAYTGSLELERAIEESLDIRREFAIEERHLTTAMRWNLAVIELRGTLNEMQDRDGRDADEPIRAHVRRFLDETLPRFSAVVEDQPNTTNLLEELGMIVGDRDETVDFGAIGPAMLRERWVFNEARSAPPQQNGRPPQRVVYSYVPRLRSDPQDLTIEFILLDTEEYSRLERPVYIARDEFSFQLLLLLIADRDVLAAVEQAVYSGRDDRPGPRVWERTSGVGFRLTQEWLLSEAQRRPPGERAFDYAPGQEPAAASAMHPLQYIPPQVAVYLADLLGCRLPTTREYEAALMHEYQRSDFETMRRQLEQNPAGMKIPNLRDITFDDQWTWAIQVEEDRRARRFTPEQGAFEASASDRSHFRFRDSTLWFAPVDEQAGRRYFNHLIGNVMEWTYDDPNTLREALETNSLSPVEIDRLLSDEHLFTMGGSALSSPQINPMVPTPVNLTSVRRNVNRGFADVGFRLALVPSGRFGTLAERVAEASRGSLLTMAGQPTEFGGESEE